MTVLDSTLAAYVKKLSLQPGDVLVVDPEKVNIEDLMRNMTGFLEANFVGVGGVVILCARGLAISRMSRDEAVRSLQALIEMKDDELEGAPV